MSPTNPNLFLQSDGFRLVCLIILYRATLSGGLVIFRPTYIILQQQQQQQQLYVTAPPRRSYRQVLNTVYADPTNGKHLSNGLISIVGVRLRFHIALCR